AAHCSFEFCASQSGIRQLRFRKQRRDSNRKQPCGKTGTKEPGRKKAHKAQATKTEHLCSLRLFAAVVLRNQAAPWMRSTSSTPGTPLIELITRSRCLTSKTSTVTSMCPFSSGAREARA